MYTLHIVLNLWNNTYTPYDIYLFTMSRLFHHPFASVDYFSWIITPPAALFCWYPCLNCWHPSPKRYGFLNGCMLGGPTAPTTQFLWISSSLPGTFFSKISNRRNYTPDPQPTTSLWFGDPSKLRYGQSTWYSPQKVAIGTWLFIIQYMVTGAIYYFTLVYVYFGVRYVFLGFSVTEFFFFPPPKASVAPVRWRRRARQLRRGRWTWKKT